MVRRSSAAREQHIEKRCRMAAMKPRTGDGPLEVTKEGRGIVMRVPLEGGGSLVVELNAEEAGALGDALKDVVARAPRGPRDPRPPGAAISARVRAEPQAAARA